MKNLVRTLTRTPKKTPKETPKKTPKKRVAFGDQVEEIPNDEAAEPTLTDKILALPHNPPLSYAPSILSAASGGDRILATRLLDAGSDVNLANRLSWSPLMYAAQKGHLEVCKLLLERGANYLSQNDKGRTALMLAASWGHSPVLELLLSWDRGNRVKKWNFARTSYVDMQDRDGRTALHHAMYVNQEACARVLLASGASQKIKDTSGSTPHYPLQTPT